MRVRIFGREQIEDELKRVIGLVAGGFDLAIGLEGLPNQERGERGKLHRRAGFPGEMVTSAGSRKGTLTPPATPTPSRWRARWRLEATRRSAAHPRRPWLSGRTAGFQGSRWAVTLVKRLPPSLESGFAPGKTTSNSRTSLLSLPV